MIILFIISILLQGATLFMAAIMGTCVQAARTAKESQDIEEMALQTSAARTVLTLTLVLQLAASALMLVARA